MAEGLHACIFHFVKPVTGFRSSSKLMWNCMVVSGICPSETSDMSFETSIIIFYDTCIF